jgi:hypothetical protein
VAVDGDCVGEVTDKEKGLTGGAHLLEGGGERVRESGAGRVGQNRPSQGGGRTFPFSFYFLFSFCLIPFLLYTNIYLCFLGAKMKYYM